MNIRTTTLNTTKEMMNYISSQETLYNTLSKQVASGKRLTTISQDPSATRSILNIKTKTNQLQAYLDNMSAAAEELKTLDSALTSLNSQINLVSDLATQAANGTYSDENLNEIKIQVDSLIDSIINISNTDYNSKYIFSGANTETKTYDIQRDATGAITSITYQGTGTDSGLARTVTISDGVSVVTNVSGGDVFGSYDKNDPTKTSGLFGTLMALSDALGNHDHNAISSTLSGLETAFNTSLTTQTKFAALANKFDITTASIESTMTTLEEYRSDLQDTDIAQALTQLVASKTALQATYSVTSDLMQNVGLLNYLK